MERELILVLSVIAVALVLFLLGKPRYDFVALLGLLVIALSGIISPDEIFSGFSHPAVITVACVLVVSRGLLNAGIVDLAASLMSRAGNHELLQMALLTGLVAIASAFMNNVGALSLFIPVTLSICRKNNLPPSRFLMPLAFASLLGGLVTLIGTPPNIIIATFRGQEGMEPFRMFDFSPVGGVVAIAGLLFIIFLGWRFLPERKGEKSAGEEMEISHYITEVLVPDNSKSEGKRLSELEMDKEEVLVVSLIRGDRKFPAPFPSRVLRSQDILVIKADAEDLQTFIDENNLELAESKEISPEVLGSDEIELMEAVVTPNSFLEGKTARQISLRNRYGVNLLALARQGRGPRGRISNVKIKAGDVLLLQGPRGVLHEVISSLGCLPLAERKLRLGQPRRIVTALLAFGLAIGAAAMGILPVQIAFLAAALFMLLAGFISPGDAYESIDWPVIILLGAMFPLSNALDVTGGTELLASYILNITVNFEPWVAILILFVGTMFLSDLVNNAAATVLMAPIALKIAAGLHVSPDPFLMAVAISASCAFLTPMGHQSNTLVMGPGGYRFSDYWRMGLPLEIIIVLTAVPLILFFWPLK